MVFTCVTDTGQLEWDIGRTVRQDIPQLSNNAVIELAVSGIVTLKIDRI